MNKRTCEVWALAYVMLGLLCLLSGALANVWYFSIPYWLLALVCWALALYDFVPDEPYGVCVNG